MTEVLQPVEMVAYQPDSIVSRVVAKNAGGNITLFAFAAGQELSEHTAPFDALVQVLDGTAEIRVAGVAYTVASGEAILMPANEPHALKANQPFKMLLTMLKAA
jgi:quercetin dioxygenase-like cupin family protein